MEAFPTVEMGKVFMQMQVLLRVAISLIVPPMPLPTEMYSILFAQIMPYRVMVLALPSMVIIRLLPITLLPNVLRVLLIARNMKPLPIILLLIAQQVLT